MSTQKILVFEVKKPWVVEEKRSPWFGTHESGVVQIPVDEFTPEKFKQLQDDGILLFLEEKEVETE